ncbi:hypothetical protein VNO77_25969 [Canavalia gladiata]|uniref:Uncharacterized protein n=1 Tax=Canavalia gladiata TaxID=3824 RepID=A0AAN9Q541_CANGL
MGLFFCGLRKRKAKGNSLGVFRGSLLRFLKIDRGLPLQIAHSSLHGGRSVSRRFGALVSFSSELLTPNSPVVGDRLVEKFDGHTGTMEGRTNVEDLGMELTLLRRRLLGNSHQGKGEEISSGFSSFEPNPAGLAKEMVQKFIEEDHEKHSNPIRRHHCCIYLNRNNDDSPDDDPNAPGGSDDSNGSSGEASGILKGQAACFGVGKRYLRAGSWRNEGVQDASRRKNPVFQFSFNIPYSLYLLIGPRNSHIC